MNYILYAIEASTWVYNFLKKGLYDTLDLSGQETHLGGRFIYYTYNGQRYLCPIITVRGPSQVCLELQDYFKNDPETLHQLMGPHGDWHGRLAELKELFVPFPTMTVSE